MKTIVLLILLTVTTANAWVPKAPRLEGLKYEGARIRMLVYC